MISPETQIYEFDDFRLDATEKELRRRGEPVPLTPKVFDALLYFVRHPGTVLGKDELMSGIWPDSFVEPNNLEQAVSLLRKKLGEWQPGREYIETVPRRGYRFATEVRQVLQGSAKEGALEEGRARPHPDVGPRRRRAQKSCVARGVHRRARRGAGGRRFLPLARADGDGRGRAGQDHRRAAVQAVGE